MQYYRPTTARVTMEPTRPDLAIVRPEPGDEPTGDDASERGLHLFRNGRAHEAMPFLEQGAQDGDARAQYVYATALFNGDNVPRDEARAFELMQRASDAGLPQAAESLLQMRAIAPPAAAQVEVCEEGKALLSDVAIAHCRTTLSAIRENVPMSDHAPNSLAAMVQALLVIELRERLETLLPDTIERAVQAAQTRAIAERS